MTPEDEPPKLEGVQYAGEEQRAITNAEEAEVDWFYEDLQDIL